MKSLFHRDSIVTGGYNPRASMGGLALLRKDIMDILKIQIGARQTGDNCYEIQPYWRGKLANKILALLAERGIYALH